MSGIAAIFHRNGRPADRDQLNRIARSLAIYGPEKQVVKCDDDIGFAYTHFTNTPEARGALQPLTSPSSRYIFLFDGRIDNRQEMADDLAIDGRRLAAASDAALALASWEKHGPACLNKWVGEFAAIVWDRKTHEISMLRDHFGRRPLHYHLTDKRLVVASMPKAIHALGDVPRELDRERLGDVLSQIDIDLTRSYFKDVAMVAPASRVIVTSSTDRSEKYYRLADHVKPIRYKNDQDYVEEADALLRQAVKACLRSPGKVGSHVSSGMDSSTVAAYAAQQLEASNERLSTYTWVPMEGFPESENSRVCFDESPSAFAMADMYPNIDVTLIGRDGPSLYDGLNEYILAAESVVRNGLNLALANATGRQARADGVKVLLQGTAGNTNLSYDGADLPIELLKRGQWIQLFRDMGAHPNSASQWRSLLRKLIPNMVIDAHRRIKGNDRSLAEHAKFLSAATAESMAARHSLERAGQIGFSYAFYPIPDERAYWMRFLENYLGPAEANLLAAMPALFGFELRDPFMDRRLMEWHFGVPERQFRRHGQERFLMQRLMAGRLPALIRNQELGKGRQSPDWLQRLQPDRDRLVRELSAASQLGSLKGILDAPYFAALLDDFPEAHEGLESVEMARHSVILPLASVVASLALYESGSNNQEGETGG